MVVGIGPLAILNSLTVTADGTFFVRTISESEAIGIVSDAMRANGVRSYVGHESTAQIISTVLGLDVQATHEQLSQGVRQLALAFKLNGRPKPGVELNREELEAIGFTLKLIYRAA